MLLPPSEAVADVVELVGRSRCCTRLFVDARSSAAAVVVKAARPDSVDSKAADVKAAPVAVVWVLELGKSGDIVAVVVGAVAVVEVAVEDRWIVEEGVDVGSRTLVGEKRRGARAVTGFVAYDKNSKSLVEGPY